MSEEEKGRNETPESDESRAQEGPAAGTAGTATPSVAAESAKTPEEIRADIGRTREELGDTVDALSDKTDVKAQVSKTVDETKQRLRDKQEEIKEKAAGAGGGDAAGQARSVLEQLAERARAEPLPYLAGALAAGILVGMLLRRRRYRVPRK